MRLVGERLQEGEFGVGSGGALSVLGGRPGLVGAWLVGHGVNRVRLVGQACGETSRRREGLTPRTGRACLGLTDRVGLLGSHGRFVGSTGAW